MMIRKRKVRIGIVGCGAIGSRIAKSVKNDLKPHCQVTALYDIDPSKSQNLSLEFTRPRIVKKTLKDLVRSCDMVVEAVNAKDTREIISMAISARKNVLAMSVGKLLNEPELFHLATKNHCTILLPSGAIAGLDAVKAASLVGISSVTLTTRKPPSGFAKSVHIREKGIDLNKIVSETVLYDGDVDHAVKLFPENINVAATIALACGVKHKMRVRIITAPDFKRNSHEIDMTGEFGHMVTRTENVVCPDNPKTSYLAVLSAIQTLKQFFNVVKIGT